MKRAHALLSILALTLGGCSKDAAVNERELDNNLRAKLFQECLRALPAGPSSTRYNDWDEVVDSCENAAYYQALVCVSGPCLKASGMSAGDSHD